MAELKPFKLPDIGEGLTEADILRWEVKVGDQVAVNQTLVEVETAKAAVELPAPFAGVVHEIHFDEGATVDVGQVIITILAGDAGGEDLVPTLPRDDAADAQAPDAQAPDAQAPAERQAVLVGYGVSGERSRRRRRAPEPDPAPSANEAFGVTPGAHAANALAPAASSLRSVLAKPPVRKLAKSLGLDLSTVAATGPNGSISRLDVEEAAKASPGQPSAAGPTGSVAPVRQPGGETRVPIRGVRKHTAAAMVGSAFTAPHVTEFVTVDVTAMMELRQRIGARREFADVKVSPLLFVARAILWAAARTPIINSTWDEAAGEIVIKHDVNLGIAAATDRGLIVPNIKAANTLSLRELAAAMQELTSVARSGKTSPAAMSGGTLTITNVGVFGIDTGTPILNPGEAAIVAFGAIRRQPWVVGTGADERIEPRWVTQLAVSFDHRSVDGQQGSEFLADVAAVLHDPGLALL